MACPFPLYSGETGHPLGGQTVTVGPPATTAITVGYTGSRGRSIVASFVGPSATETASSSVTFTKYGSQKIPDTFLLPCAGSGTVVLSPMPTSKTAQSFSMTVIYGNVTVGPPHSRGLSVSSSRTIKGDTERQRAEL